MKFTTIDREHQRQAEQEGSEADDHRHDGRHDGAAPPVVAQDPDGITDEVVELVPQPGVDLGDDRAPQAGAVLEQVVHDERAQDQAAGQADQGAEAGNHLGQDAAGDHRLGVLGCRPGLVQGGLVDTQSAGLVGRVVKRRVDCGAELISLLGHAPDGGDHDDGHHGEQTEDDQAGGQGGLEPVAYQGADQGFEDHGEHGCEGQREHDLAHRGPAR
jgi:hypothetical protein